MEPGIYPNLSYKEYDQIEAFRAGMFQPLTLSPAHLKADLGREDEDSAERRIGRAVHSLILEPNTFGLNYVIKKHDGRTKDGKEEKDRAEQLGATLLPKEEYGTALRASESLLQDKTIRAILKGAEKELTLVWNDEAGCRCKARLDAYDKELGVLYDFKTTRMAAFGLFRKELEARGYYLQLPFYARGLKALGLPIVDIVFIAVEKVAPFEFRIFRLEDRAVALAEAVITDLLKQYTYCQQSGNWPGYSHTIEDIGLPEWKQKQLEEQYNAV